jgi:hypothetical protein
MIQVTPQQPADITLHVMQNQLNSLSVHKECTMTPPPHTHTHKSARGCLSVDKIIKVTALPKCLSACFFTRNPYIFF